MNKSLVYAVSCFAALGAAGCDDTKWNHEPKVVVEVQPLPCPWASAATQLAGRQVAPGSSTFCILFVTPASGIDAFELETSASVPRRGLPPTPEQVAQYRFPPLLILDAATGAIEEVPWGRWAQCTGQTFSNGIGDVRMPIKVAVAEPGRATVDGTPVGTAAPYANFIGQVPGGADLVVYTAFGPTERCGGIAAPDVVVPLGDMVIEWLVSGDPAKHRDVVHRLVGSSSPSYAAIVSRGTTGAWTPDGRYYLVTRDDKLWIVPNPEFGPVPEPAADRAAGGMRP